MPANRPLVSVLCATYQYGPYVAAAIDSVLGQDYPRIEMVVVNDGSTDETAAVLDRYGDRIISITTPNRGQNAAFNTAFAASSGDIVCLLDADDRMRPGKLAKVVQAFGTGTDIGWVFHHLRYVDLHSGDEVDTPSTAWQQLPPTGRYDMREVMRNGELPIIAPAASGLTFRRSTLGSLMPLPELKAFGDHYIKFGAMAATPGCYVGEALADQGIHTANAYTNRSDNSVFRARRMVNVARELGRWDASLAPFTDLLLVQGLMMSRWGRDLPAAERGSLRQWRREASARRQLGLLAALLGATARRVRRRAVSR